MCGNVKLSIHLFLFLADVVISGSPGSIMLCVGFLEFPFGRGNIQYIRVVSYTYCCTRTCGFLVGDSFAHILIYFLNLRQLVCAHSFEQ